MMKQAFLELLPVLPFTSITVTLEKPQHLGFYLNKSPSDQSTLPNTKVIQ